jgi:hypothetical protein
MTLPSATMRSIGPGTAEGALTGHPDPDILVRTQRLTDTEMTVWLWSFGKHLIGQGLLTLRDGAWRGRCTEYAGEWHCEACAGSPTLEFSEHAPEETVA